MLLSDKEKTPHKGFAFSTLPHIPMSSWSISWCSSLLLCSQIGSLSKFPKLAGMPSHTPLSHALYAPSAYTAQTSLCVSLDWYLNPLGHRGKTHYWALSASYFIPCLTSRGKGRMLFDTFCFLHWCLLRIKIDLHPRENMIWFYLLSKDSPYNLLMWHLSAHLSF